MRTHFILFCSLFWGCLLSASAQKWQLSLEAGGQHSFIPAYTHMADRQPCPPSSGYCSITATNDIAYTYQNRPAGYVKLNLGYRSNERLQVYHSLGFSLLRFQPTVSETSSGENPTSYCYERDENGNLIAVPCDDNNTLRYSDSRSGRTSVLYALQELGASYQLLARFSVQAGFDLSYKLYSQLYAPEMYYTPGSSWEDPGEYYFEMEKDRSGTGFRSVLLGVHTGIAYELTDRFSLSLALQHSLSPVYNGEERIGKGYERSRASQLRLGVRYTVRSW
ncbi:hypothetical protein [Cesiribacter andamanensis]|uniref:Outer membrane protein beta-barrel domain-containing protein n=1 Tax=Cesiribacter andamanensis AMV16 TaxID=1279009 RepID=M7MWK8_9BACT|nr:hypothetical protein [Cesiribacter andamanensis]EMR00788.1 hypothetical protein ADICEAN_04087 [Cesiribacter andamanensis AMV16]